MADKYEISSEKKFSLVELLMIIMLVGIIATIVIPMQLQNRNQEILKEAIYNLQVIAQKNQEFFDNPDNGYYAFDITMLNITDDMYRKYAESNSTIFDYSVENEMITATMKDTLNIGGAKVTYNTKDETFSLGADKTSQNAFDSAWLP